MQKKAADGDDDDQQQDGQDGDEDGAKKFKPEDYDWFELSNTEATFPQFFAEMHHTKLVVSIDIAH